MRCQRKPLAVLTVLLLVIAVLCTGCGQGYSVITMKRAVEIMNTDDDCLIVDVRTESEYEESHIPGAILLPIEEIREGNVGRLSDKRQTLLLYCRTGRRAEDSAVILADLGYTSVYSMGGIVDWTGEFETGPET